MDGKKISRGKGKIAGDIDNWGFESTPTLKERKVALQIETCSRQTRWFGKYWIV
jgi:hypothetical protein